jgi:hypothetical protein
MTRQFFDVAEEFRAHAAECQRLADCWCEEGKRQYEALARQWLKLAEHAIEQSGEPTGRGAIGRNYRPMLLIPRTLNH